MAKYKVGDRVRIVKERTWDMSSYGDMDEYLGTIMTITFSPPKDEGNGYQMKEDGGKYSWTIGMIAGLVNDKVELHPDFKEWYEGIESYWISKGSSKAFAIACVNKIGFDCGLTNARGHTVSGKYAQLTYEMQSNKEKYTRAILDDNWTVRKEKMYEVVLNITVNDNRQMLMKDARQSFIEYESENKGYYTQEFTEKEIKAIDERYFAFAEPVEED